MLQYTKTDDFIKGRFRKWNIEDIALEEMQIWFFTIV